MEQQTPTPQFKDEALAKANMRYFPTLHFGEGWYKFSFFLSKTVCGSFTS